MKELIKDRKNRSININELMSIVKSKLHNAGFDDVIAELERQALGGATGGEVSGITGKFLRDLESLNPPAYQIIKDEVILYSENFNGLRK